MRGQGVKREEAEEKILGKLTAYHIVRTQQNVSPLSFHLPFSRMKFLA